MTLTEKTLAASLVWQSVKVVAVAAFLVFICYTFANHEIRIRIEITEKPSTKEEAK